MDGTEVDWFKIPTKIEIPGTEKRIIDAKALKDYLDNFNILTCYVEKQARKNPKLNANYGICLAVLMILEIPTLAIVPTSWMGSLKKKAGLEPIKQGVNKAFTFYAFNTIFPEITLPKKEGGLDDDIADACLLAWLCYLNIQIEGD